jgi:hypothetical protein
MRLIDADNLNFEGQKYNKSQMKSILDFIDKQPTTYDADKVVKRLRKELKLANKEKQRRAKENICQFDEVKGYVRAIDVAIDIVKAGGKNE